MKTYHYTKYVFCGKNEEGLYVFRSRHKNPEDRETVLVKHARYVRSDGKVSYYLSDYDDTLSKTYDELVEEMSKLD